MVYNKSYQRILGLFLYKNCCCECTLEFCKQCDIMSTNPGRFGPGSFRPGSIRPGSFRPILGVGRFGLGRWVVSANFRGESIRPCRFGQVFIN